MSSQPLFIGGCPRSGTTALIQVLNSNSGVFISSEENLLTLSQQLSKLLSTQERRAENTKGGMRALSVRETLNLDNIHQYNFTKKSLWASVRYTYKWHHNKIHPNSELILWGDKLPNYYQNIRAVLKLPKTRYLHITRHPFDVINSMLRRTDMAQQGLDWWKAVTEFNSMLSVWGEAYNAICEYEHHDRVLHIHYEDLVFNFAHTIEAINSFLGIELIYQNILVTEPEKHFDRSYLSKEQQQQILDAPAVQNYISARPNLII